MARINLLPWREELRKQKKREFGAVAGGSALLMACVILFAHMHIGGMINHQQSRNRFLQEEITAVEAKIKEISDLEKQKQQLLARMRIIEQLQRNRPEIVHLFQELVELTPDGLHLDELKQSESTINVKGKAQSNARVSSFMRAVDSSDWFTKPKLDLIQSGNQSIDRTRTFAMQFQQANPLATEAKE